MERLFRQLGDNTCAVAGLRSILSAQFGARVSEPALRFAGDSADAPILKHGTNTRALRRMLRAADTALNADRPWRLAVRRSATIRDIAREVRAGRLPLVSVERGDEHEELSHVVVVTDYRPGSVRYFDPHTGRTSWKGVGAFRKEWVDRRGDTWMAVVTGGRPQ